MVFAVAAYFQRRRKINLDFKKEKLQPSFSGLMLKVAVFLRNLNSTWLKMNARDFLTFGFPDLESLRVTSFFKTHSSDGRKNEMTRPRAGASRTRFKG